MMYLQVASAVIGLLFGLVQISKESIPLLKKAQDHISQDAVQKANIIHNMKIEWIHRGRDNNWNYYSDPTGRFWARVDLNGICEYSENPNP
jgi:alpha-beta hydrolase superfamily lysophospholipase